MSTYTDRALGDEDSETVSDWLFSFSEITLAPNNHDLGMDSDYVSDGSDDSDNVSDYESDDSDDSGDSRNSDPEHTDYETGICYNTNWLFADFWVLCIPCTCLFGPLLIS